MFAWLSKQAWTRRTRWTPLLQSQREFQRSLSKERSRVERNGSCFGFIILRLEDLTNLRSQTCKLARMLHKRLRDSDEKGHLGPGRVGIVLPDANSEQAEYVLLELLKLAAAHNLKVDGESFVYPDQDQKPKTPSELFPGETVSSEETSMAKKAASDPVSAPLAIMVADYPRWKRSLDVIGSLTGLILASPILLVAAALIKLTSHGPVFFKQKRTGFLGHAFDIYKLRTMVQNAEQMQANLFASNERDGPAFKMRHDPRITFVGRFLRATGVDELPQLLNVLRGEMALVGPRPLPVHEAAQCLPWQRRRQEVRPGLTCFWQISKSREIAFADWMRLDLSYASRITLWLDIKLIFRTVGSVVLGRVGH